MEIDPRMPVLVGVGTCFDDVEASELLIRATQAAADDAGSDALLGAVERIVVPHGTWSYSDPARLVAQAIGASSATTVLVDVGIPQQTLIDEAMSAIIAGDVDVVVVAGAEAKARSARLKSQNTRADRSGIVQVFSGGTDEAVATETQQVDAVPDVHQHPVGDLIDAAELAAGLYVPVEQYALIESALGAAERRTPDQLRRDVSELYARFNDVAALNPHAAFPAPMSADELATFSPSNRPLAFPYAKWHVTQWTVDQAASLILCSAEAAERLGVDPSRSVYPLVGLGSSHMAPVSRRRDMHRWPAMQVLGEHAERRLGHPVADCELAELYSCFPVAVRIQQRELGMPLDGTPTVTGGMSFGGGPFNSFVLQSLAAMVQRLRAEGGRAVVTSVSGFLTKPGLGVWSTAPDGEMPLIADRGDEIGERTETATVLAEFQGPVQVIAATVTYDGQDPKEVVVIADTPDGDRVIAKASDAGLIDRALGEGLVGDDLEVDGTTLVG